jgi:hypothetical protein
VSRGSAYGNQQSWKPYGPLDACGCLRQVIREDTNTRLCFPS